MQAQLLQLRELLGNDPVLLYSLAAALLLALVSLSSGVGRADAAALTNPRNLVRVLGAVALAFVLRAAAESWQSAALPDVLAAILPGLHRFPLYLVALAYGPTTGLLTGVLFAAFASSTLLPGTREAVLALELSVLGWLAIYPSPRQTRWAGPLNAALAYVLAWGTAGISLMALRGAEINLATVLAEHRPLLPGLGLVLLLLLLVGPRAYRMAFPHSRIELVTRRAASPTLEAAAPTPAPTLTPRGFDTAELSREPRSQRRRPTLVALAELGSGRAKRVRVRRLAARSLPDDELVH